MNFHKQKKPQNISSLVDSTLKALVSESSFYLEIHDTSCIDIHPLCSLNLLIKILLTF